jgi:hypothetical protein
MDVISSLPRDTGHMRHILFTLPLPFSLSAANHERFWPLIDNVYSIRRSRDIPERQATWLRAATPCHQLHYVSCRFKRARAVPSTSTGARASTSKRVVSGCDVTFQLLKFEDHVEYRPNGQSLSITCQHAHSLDESDANKRNSFLRALAGAEIAKGYPPALIIRSLNGNGRADARVRLAAAGGAFLDTQDVINAGLAWRQANPYRVWASKDVKDDVSLQAIDALEKLTSLKWKVAQVSATSLDGEDGRGIVFADPARLRVLATHGYLSLIDSTHKTNQLGWKLFTLMARDQYASWHPVAHALLSNEFGELIAEFLLVIKGWCTWQLRYVLSDDSGAEQRAFRLAFPGLVRGEMEVSEPDISYLLSITLFLIRPLITLR